MRNSVLTFLLAASLLGCPLASPPSNTVEAASAGAAPGGGVGSSTPGGAEAEAPIGSPQRAPAPAIGPEAGAVFFETKVLAHEGGGVQTFPSWDAAGPAQSRAAGCAEETLELKQGLVWVVCTRLPVGGYKTGWTKFEITGVSVGSYDFRYLHWPADGGDALSGTGKWTPDPTNPSLTYTPDKEVSGTSSPPARRPGVDDPGARGPALTAPEPGDDATPGVK